MARIQHTKKSMILVWSFASAIALAMGLSIYFVQGTYDLRALINATFIPGATLLGLAGLILISRTGNFDIMAYSFVAMGQRFRPREMRQYEDAVDYKAKAEERRSKKGGYILPYLIWGGALLITALIANIVFMTSI